MRFPPSSQQHRRDLQRPPPAGDMSGGADSFLHYIHGSDKGFDKVNRKELWEIMPKFGCPERFTQIWRRLHDGIMARVTDNGAVLEALASTDGVKQSCVLASTLLSHMLSAILIYA
ncbi:hypothetical protein SprV_0100180700 [Sparganum proliferum]